MIFDHSNAVFLGNQSDVMNLAFTFTAGAWEIKKGMEDIFFRSFANQIITVSSAQGQLGKPFVEIWYPFLFSI
jgi:hypothetical protein